MYMTTAAAREENKLSIPMPQERVSPFSFSVVARIRPVDQHRVFPRVCVDVDGIVPPMQALSSMFWPRKMRRGAQMPSAGPPAARTDGEPADAKEPGAASSATTRTICGAHSQKSFP